MTDLRTALDGLTEGRVAPTDLADQALAGRARRHRRNWVLAPTAAVVLVAAIAIPVTRFHSAPANRSGNGQQAPGRYVILSYDAYTDETANPGRAWDPDTHR